MAKIVIPNPLKQLLEGSDFHAPIRGLADRVGEILADNKLPFFPDYTDHGADHINCVLKSEMELVPRHVLENSKKDSDPRLLCEADAAVIIGATLLHDIAMHLRPDGFRELVSKDSRFRPLPWFKESHEGHPADHPWQDLWENYIREARRFTDRNLTNIIGEESARMWKFHDLPEDHGQWERNHCLIVGEFIRRHHARLAHEVAIYGFPGVPIGSGEGQFPAMGKEEGHPLMRLADLIGLTARSHWMSLRVCKSYLESSALYPGTPRPMGTAVLFPMAMLRVADYLQIDQQRAPAILMQLRNLQSPVSVMEWKKHRAVQNIGPATDPRGKMVTVSTDLSLMLYLQLRELLTGLQTEMDHSTAVLDEAYGTLTELGLNQLNLATRRVYSNLQSPAFQDSLPYVPDRTGFSADPNLLTLLVEPLYGKQPGVGVRELMQNAVDAVCELKAWCAARGKSVKSLDLPVQDADVLIEFIKRKNGRWFLRVRDRGIGMGSGTIQNYFLRAGASFRQSAEWAKEFLDQKGQPRVVRAGRFGIGAFAVFLLGSSFRLLTRHAGAAKATGYMIEASVNSRLVEIRRVDGLPIGTTVEVELSDEAVANLYLNKKEIGYGISMSDWFCWNWPSVIVRVVLGKKLLKWKQKHFCKIRNGQPSPEWCVIHPKGFDAVYWTFSDGPPLVCNGIEIRTPPFSGERDVTFDWPSQIQLRRPNIAILDSAANMPLTTQRYRLSQKTLPFTNELARDVMLSFIAYALVCGPPSQSDSLSSEENYALLLRGFSEYCSSPDDDNTADKLITPFSQGLLRWCSTAISMVPADPWLYTLLGEESCLVFGGLTASRGGYEPYIKRTVFPLSAVPSSGFAILPWHGLMTFDESILDDDVAFVSCLENEQELEWWPVRILTKLAHEGVVAVGHNVRAAKVLVSSSPRFTFTSAPPKSSYVGKELDFKIWRKIGDSKAQRRYFEASNGKSASTFPLQATLKAMDAASIDYVRQPSWRKMRSPDIRFVSEIKTKRIQRSPESLIAKIWNECLGARAIPFDTDARNSLIEDGCKHPELKRHIQAWQKMKRRGSRRVAKK